MAETKRRANSGIKNLKPIKPGEVRNPHGRPGAKNLSTIIKDILEEGAIEWEKVPIKGSAEMSRKYGKNGWRAIVYIATAQALSGNIQAMKFLQQAQYGVAGPQLNVNFNAVVAQQRQHYEI